MGDIIMEFYKRASSLSYAEAKALANYLFREIIEDAHVKYRISQADMKEMCKNALARADYFLKILEDPKLRKAFLIEAMGCQEWDDPEMTEDIRDMKKILDKISKELV